MRFKNNFLKNYLKEAPTALAIERTFECEILSQQVFTRPILDLGCGEGLFAYILFDEKIDVGIDPNMKELQRTEKYKMYTELINCFGNEIPKPNNSFNTIFSNSVIEHIIDIEPVLQEIYRLLIDGGQLYLTVPTNYFDKYSVLYQLLIKLGLFKGAEKYRIFFNNFWQHYHYYDVDAWEKLFRKHRFKIVKVQQYCSKKVCLINDFLAPFSILRLIAKKTLNRWYIFKPFILFESVIKNTVFRDTILNDKDLQKGGIVFFHLKK